MKTFTQYRLHEDVDYGSATKALRAEIDGAIALVKSRGIRIPAVKVFNRAGSMNGALYSPSNDCIFIGSRLPKLLSGSPPFHATNHRYQLFIHEIGHMLHSDVVGSAYDNLKNSNYYLNAFDVEKEVSRYAKTNALEFVAEVFTGLFTGKTYVDIVMRQYDMLRGPRP